MNSSLRVFIADDHAVVRRGLKEILLDEFNPVQLGEAEDGQQTLRQINDQPWDVVLLDIHMPGANGFSVLNEIKRTRPHLPVLVLSAASEADYALRTLKAGANGFINKQFATEELVTAIRAVLAGQNYLGAAATRKLVADVSPGAARAAHEKLSRREFQIFNLVAQAKSVKEIASELSLSGKTVGTYLARIKQKTGLSTPVEIARYALQNKLVD